MSIGTHTTSGLDNFGARYYASNLGRFLTPDWSAVPVAVPYATLSDPQSLNLYSYVTNRPTVLVDADGHGDDTRKADKGGAQATQNCSGRVPHPCPPEAGRRSKGGVVAHAEALNPRALRRQRLTNPWGAFSIASLSAAP